ncbi:MAG: hypothetical protein MUF49_28430, partial [Oculatellaceae cyanobacterium Prado106]|nr:hypothetical protein [Oculatellaceae cyanobacterium Prado106]
SPLPTLSENPHPWATLTSILPSRFRRVVYLAKSRSGANSVNFEDFCANGIYEQSTKFTQQSPRYPDAATPAAGAIARCQ